MQLNPLQSNTKRWMSYCNSYEAANKIICIRMSIFIYMHIYIYTYTYICIYTNLLRSDTKRWMSCCNSYEAAHRICATHKPIKWKRLSPKFCSNSYCVFLVRFKRQICQKRPTLNPYFLPSKQCFRQGNFRATHNPKKGTQFSPGKKNEFKKIWKIDFSSKFFEPHTIQGKERNSALDHVAARTVFFFGSKDIWIKREQYENIVLRLTKATHKQSKGLRFSPLMCVPLKKKCVPLKQENIICV